MRGKINVGYGLKPSPHTQVKAYHELSGKPQSWKTTLFLGKGRQNQSTKTRKRERMYKM